MVTATIALRAATPADEPLLRDLFGETRADVLAGSGLDAARVTALLDLQYAARARQYATAHPAAVDHVVLLDGRPVGRLLAAETDDDVRVVDIAIAARERGRGIGTAVLGDWCERAEASGRSLSLTVAPGNPAIRLYERLGLEIESSDTTGARMRRRAGRGARV